MQDITEESLIHIHKDIQNHVILFGSTQERNALLLQADKIAKPTDDTVTMDFSFLHNVESSNKIDSSHNMDSINHADSSYNIDKINSIDLSHNMDKNLSISRHNDKNFIKWHASTEECNNFLKNLGLSVNPTDNTASMQCSSEQLSNSDAHAMKNDSVAHAHAMKNDPVAHAHAMQNDSVAHAHAMQNDSVAHAHVMQNDSIAHAHAMQNDSVAHAHAMQNDSVARKNSLNSSLETPKKINGLETPKKINDANKDDIHFMSTVSLSQHESKLSKSDKMNLDFLRDHYFNFIPESDAPNRSFGQEATPLHSIIFQYSLPAPSFPVDSIVDNRYRIIRCLNEDTGHNIFLVKSLFASDKEYFILETLPKICCADSHNIGVFYQGLFSLLTLKHERIIQVYEFNITHDNIMYIIQDYVPSAITLAAFLRKNSKINPSRAISILIQLLRILKVYHDSSIIHGNINPHDILIVSSHNRDHVYIKSFALYPLIQKCLDPTKQRVIIGDMPYLAPEYIHSLSKSCDIYSLGVIFFEMLVGSLPFSGNQYTMLAQKYNSLPNLSCVPSPYDSIIEQALDKDVTERFQSVADFLDFVKQFKKVSIRYNELSYEKKQNHSLIFSLFANSVFVVFFLMFFLYNLLYCKQLEENFSTAIKNQEISFALYSLNTIENNYFYHCASIIYKLKSKAECQKQYKLFKQKMKLQQKNKSI